MTHYPALEALRAALKGLGVWLFHTGAMQEAWRDSLDGAPVSLWSGRTWAERADLALYIGKTWALVALVAALRFLFL